MESLESINNCFQRVGFPEIPLVLNFLTKNQVEEEIIENFKKNYEDIRQSDLVKECLYGTGFLTALSVAFNANVLEFFLYSLEKIVEEEKRREENWKIIREKQEALSW